MRIFYFITKSEAGGAQTHIFQLCRFLRAARHEVAVMSYPGGWLEGEVKKLGARFYPNPYLTNTPNPIADFLAAAEFKKALRDFQPDLVSCHSTKAGIIGRLTLRNRIPTIFTAHGWGFTPGVGTPQRLVVLLAERIAAPYAAKIICVSDYDRRLALRSRLAPPEKLVTIHNGVEIAKEDASPRSLAEKSPHEIRIIFVGRLATQKDPLLLLRAYRDLPEELRSRGRVEFVGDGPLRKRLEGAVRDFRLEDRVVLHGNLPREEVFRLLKGAHLFVLTSNYEGFPRSVLEAMSVGLPVIATDVGGVREIVTPDCGILVARGDVSAVKQALETLMRDSSRREAMGKNARARIENFFSLQKMCETTHSLYDAVLTASRESHFQ